MQLAVRSYLTAGVALVGAGAIAVSPISLAPPEVHVPALSASAAAVNLAAAVDPITEWVQVLQTTFANVAAIGSQVQSDPAPILQQFITNQLAYANIIAPALEQAAGSLVAGVTSIPQALITAATQLAAGNFNDAVQTVFQTGLGLVLAPAISLLNIPQIFTTASQNFANVVAAIPNVLLPIGLAALSPLAGAAYVFGNTGQQIIDAVKVGDVGAAINVIVNAPAAFTDAILNGVESQGTVGLLSPYTGQFSSGLVASLLHARDVFAQAIGAPVPPSAQAVTNSVGELPTAAKTVTLSTAAPAPSTARSSAAAVKVTNATESTGSTSSVKSAAASGGADTVGSAPDTTSAGAGTGSSSTDSSSTPAGSTGSGKHRAQSGSASGSSKSSDSAAKAAKSSSKKSSGSSSSD
ncbi:hypothetical protein [Mycolicibacterium komossense]|uniref:PE-PGRS family protein n=1 Tax=Mycolicibacterium komossense TaxID=1779 RepID=A0ABT3CBD8_9MYCO|nr:hypothetical protein [Mycolicibacterium komossense]MCV7226576.1 hypothetical protein [Mycolicibacterium komossense]